MTDYSAIASQYGGTPEPSSTDYSAVAVKFGGQPVQADPQIGNPQELTFAEKYIAPLLEKVGLEGNLRGSSVGGMMQGAADPGVKIAQLVANVIPGGGQAVNQAVQNEEQQYQNARSEAGRGGWDIARGLGQAAITAPVGALGGAPTTLLGMIGKGALQGGVTGALQPVTNGGQNFWMDTAKDAGIGALTGGVIGGAVGSLARVVSPNASVNADVQLLRNEGVTPTLGQSLGGVANTIEQKAQSLPFVGDAIGAARQRAEGQLRGAGFARAATPIGESISSTGNEGIQELSQKLGQEYERVLPKLSVNVMDPDFVQRMSNLRGLVQGLPESERNQFDSTISRAIDDRLTGNGDLVGQNLKDAWNSLRDAGKTFSKSDDAYQSQLGQAFKQAFQELKDQVTSTNSAPDVAALRNVDFGYANFKRLQRAASSVDAPEGNFNPSQLLSSVKALDQSKDKGAFASGNALMQDLAGAGKRVLGNTVRDSGTTGRAVLASLITGTPFAPHITLPAMGGMVAGGAAYSRPVQNMLAAIVAKRPDMAPEVANYLRRLTAPATLATVPVATNQ